MMKSIIRLFAQVDIDEGQLNLPPSALPDNTFTNALRFVFAVAGAVALIIITIGGFKYVISQGNPQETTKAKNTILYAVIGLVVCITAYSIVTFVINEII